MRTVNIGDLKARLSSHIQSVRRGEEVLVCDRNRPVARIVPVGLQEFSESEKRLITRGLLVPPLRKRPAGGFSWPQPPGNVSEMKSWSSYGAKSGTDAKAHSRFLGHERAGSTLCAAECDRPRYLSLSDPRCSCLVGYFRRDRQRAGSSTAPRADWPNRQLEGPQAFGDAGAVMVGDSTLGGSSKSGAGCLWIATICAQRIRSN